MSEMAVQVLVCVLVADFISGVGHWFEDTYGLPTWPLIGKSVIEPNIEHHRNPNWMVTMGSVIGRNYQLMGVASIVCCVACVAGVLSWQASLTAFLVGMSNEVHAWHHGAGRHPFVQLLRDMAIVQTPQHHAKHHQPPYDGRFCVLTNLVNPVLDRLRFWRVIEWLIGWLAGVHPKRMTAERSFL